MKTIEAIRKITLIGALVNIILAIVKIVVGSVSGSSALVADGVHSFSDLLTDAVVLFGAQYWIAPADAKHPYGHYRYETMCNLIIGTLLLFTAAGIAWDSIDRIGSSEAVAPSMWALVAALGSIGAKELLYRWTFRCANDVGSSALRANAWHHRSDALSSVPVVLSVIAAPFVPEYYYLDQIAALLVTAMILKGAVSIVLPSLQEITERSAGQEVIGRIQQHAAEHNDVKEVHAIRSRRAGNATFVDFHLLVQPDLTVREGHDIAKDFKLRLMKESNEMLDIIIHIEPYEPRPQVY
ncbi:MULTISPECIES: cation diffusion facilitator family transporter [Vibrio]|uniref:Putative cation efflux system protein/MT2084 n=1 Tax=Vibrio celticus TaxID=446372 RepID=A0A1C3JC88_9VIBR|nr:cation diffusion facilitator family transporter [Vibrio celticus]MDR9829421.1 cation diffusion facilitator family transporter [Vibrio sp. FNV 38]SBT12728.1 putative cation efflux system protein/MT2084 [Vibrio celticus]